MFKLTESAVVDRPAAEVFDTAADPEKQLQWDPATLKSVEKLTPGPLGRGSRYRGKFSGFGVVEYEYAEFEVGRRFSHRASMSMGALNHVFEFQPSGAGTRVTQTIQFEPRGVGKLLAPFMRNMMQKRMRTIGAELNAYMAR